MAIVDFALEHARQGRLVFPGAPNTKIPAITNPYEHATTEEAQIIQWWQENPNYNICLPGGYEIGPGQFIGFIDVDCKKEGKNGFDTMKDLDVLGFEFPETLAQVTPTGGLHLFYFFDFPIQNSAGLLGKGLDTRGFHGYVMAAGSLLDGKGYVFKNRLQIAQAPQWLVDRCKRAGSPGTNKLGQLHIVNSIEQSTAEGRATSYLASITTATSGERNRRGYEAACRLKDFGLVQANALRCMLTHWAAEPALEESEVEALVASAYKYSQNEPGVDAAENIFDAIPEEPGAKKPRTPIEILNEKYAIVIQNGVRILRDTKTKDGKPRVDHLSIQAFHDIEANNLVVSEEKTIAMSKVWMRSKKRKQFEGIIFMPNYENPAFYNVWRGFSVAMPTGEPHPKGVRALELFLEHIRENVCSGNEAWADWVIGFFAHLIQKPEQKPGVALVLRGRKGVGKNVVTDCIFRLLGDHCLLAANRRYLSGNFNSHLENKLMLVLDEAFWSGDKAAEGILKDLITGSTQQIERKGHDSYTIDNLMRVVIFGNEEWIVPATDDERRFAVFNVGDARRGDRDYFGEIKDGMRDFGGDALLFKYLKEFDLNKTNVNVAPDTDALMSQKEHTLGPVETWWLECLKTGEIPRVGDWAPEVPKDALRASFYDWAKIHARNKVPTPNGFGKTFNQIAPRSRDIIHRREGEIRHRLQRLALIEQAREDWEKFIGGKTDWPVIES